jgi:hypothetical protein
MFVRVTDTGGGIEEDKLSGIFEPFVQVDSGTTRAKEGSGLGLTISRRLARLMGGDLTVKSELGKGSAFTLWLLAEQESEEAPGDTDDPGSQDEAKASGPPPQAGTTVSVEPNVEGLAEVGGALLACMESTVESIVSRIRRDPNLAVAAGLRNSQVADHLTTFLADVAGALIMIEEAEGKHSNMLADGIEIQRLISERHGTLRARLGWAESDLRREFMIIREELERAVLHELGDAQRPRFADAIAVLNRFIDHSEFVAVRSLDAAHRG